MFGQSKFRDAWNTQWGPEPVLALIDNAAGDRRAPITLPGGAGALGIGAGARRGAGRI